MNLNPNLPSVPHTANPLVAQRGQCQTDAVLCCPATTQMTKLVGIELEAAPRPTQGWIAHIHANVIAAAMLGQHDTVLPSSLVQTLAVAISPYLQEHKAC